MYVNGTTGIQEITEINGTVEIVLDPLPIPIEKNSPYLLYIRHLSLALYYKTKLLPGRNTDELEQTVQRFGSDLVKEAFGIV